MATVLLALLPLLHLLQPAALACADPLGAGGLPDEVAVSRLRTEYLANPLGIDERHPRLSWILRSSRHGLAQTAYQLQVGSSAKVLRAGTPDIWDSGKVRSSESVNAVYDGPALVSSTRYHWRVRVWDTSQQSSAWSEPAWWETGLLRAGDWVGRWISPTKHAGGSYLRAEFQLPARPIRARAYLTARGGYERGPDGEGFCCGQSFGLARGLADASLNGRRIGDAVLDPPPVDTRARALYRTEDATALVHKGENALGVMIGEDSDVLVQLEVDLEDGTTVRVGTDEHWRTAPAPVRAAHRYHGETYDARREQAAWDSPGFDDRAWQPVLAAEGPRGTVSAAMLQPMRVVATHRAENVRAVGNDVWLLDFGTNMTGWTRLDVDVPAGTEIRLKHGEVLDGEGRIDNGSIGADGQRLDPERIGAQQTNRFIAGARRPTGWEPRFVYAGFRYVEVSGLPEPPTRATVTAREVHNDVPTAGHFSSSDRLLNRLHEAIVQTQRNAMHGIPEDTPTREKRGWLADAHVAAPSVMNNMDAAAFYTKFVRDLRDAQQDSGMMPDIVPVEPTAEWEGRSDPAWGVATILVPYDLYKSEGDVRILERHYSAMAAWIDHLRTETSAYIVDEPVHAWGNDWVAIEDTSGPLFRTGFYYWSARLMSEIAAELGRHEDAVAYAALAEDIGKAFNQAFFDERTSSYGDTQFANAFPLFLGLVPTGHRPGVQEHLVRDVAEHDGHFTGGLPGITYIPDALTTAGRSDVVLDVLRRRDYPSWGYMLEQGPGTVWERWDGLGSRNHPMFTSIDGWLYRVVAGIDQHKDGAGFKRLVFAPRVTDRLERAAASLETPYGEAVSSWCHVDGALVYDVTVPANTTAEVRVPAETAAQVTVRSTGDRGVPASDPVEAEFRRMAGGSAVYHTRSGTYQFVSEVRPSGAR